MKILKLTLLLIVCGFNVIHSPNNPEKLKIYRVRIKFIDESKPLTGVLYQIKDSSIIVSTSLQKEDYITNNFKKSEILIKDIKIIRARRKNYFIRSTIKGFAGGVIVTLVAIIGREDPWLGDSGVFILASFTGVGIGSLVGFFTGRYGILINGDIKKFNLYRAKFEKRSIFTQLEIAKYAHKRR